MKIDSSRFERSATRPEDEPRAPGPDVIFLGRSNVGKSSLINRLLGVKGLARTSSRPGRTQTVNFYRINESFQFVDLPGYGYAKVPEAVRLAWGPMVERFLDHRLSRIVLAVLIVDARHRPTKLDVTMREWLDWRSIDYVVAATKADKLSGNARAVAMRALPGGLGLTESAASPIATSAKTGLGIGAIWKRIDAALVAEEGK